MLKAAPYQTDFSAFPLDPAGIIIESGATRTLSTNAAHRSQS